MSNEEDGQGLYEVFNEGLYLWMKNLSVIGALIIGVLSNWFPDLKDPYLFMFITFFAVTVTFENLMIKGRWNFYKNLFQKYREEAKDYEERYKAIKRLGGDLAISCRYCGDGISTHTISTEEGGIAVLCSGDHVKKTCMSYRGTVLDMAKVFRQT